MVTVVGVRFKRAGKIYYFSPESLNVKKGNNVIVETARGIEFGECVVGPKQVGDSEIVSPLKNVIRVATNDDIKKHAENKSKEKEAFNICLEKIEKHNLKMKLIDVEYTFDNNKVIFYFTADGRIDFRELVKDLASIFRTRIELRQIGVRDEAKMVGGLGSCGRPMCCSSFLGDFAPVSIKMAKEQNLSLNPTKISGICGRLMCCLNYEQETYEKIRKRLPKVKSIVNTVYGKGEVIANSVVKESVKVKVKIEDGDDIVEELPISEVTIVSGSFEGTVNEDDIKIDVENSEDAHIIKELFKED
ncbi:stage 0 sporulation family protein [Clostridium sp. JN-1]|uniref:PSP1 domain-containing protein n=1 Tax=Clostridium sp. JN-1 TaxID=2483110 RepID=UPI000F0B4D99|nr:stage 0 sporulation family protein [Clostridium sp. JN-1]